MSKRHGNDVQELVGPELSMISTWNMSSFSIGGSAVRSGITPGTTTRTCLSWNNVATVL
jgi:hypothetical protein